ncbi:putative starch synthase [Dioscorea sansibarensis]
MLVALQTAIKSYRENKSLWEGLMKRGMLKDFSWGSAATKYEQIIEWALMDPPFIR